MRIARLAEQAGVSLSRTSRLLDSLEQRGLLKRRRWPRRQPREQRPADRRRPAPGPRGAAAHLADVQRVFFDRLTAGQISTLAGAFARLAPQAA
jgi:hypothetical protein